MADLQKIQFMRTKTSGLWPTTDQIAEGELAINLQDRLLFTNDGTGNIINLGFAKGGNVDGNITIDRDQSMLRVGNDKDFGIIKQTGAKAFLAINNVNAFVIKKANTTEITPDSTYTPIFTINNSGTVNAAAFNGPLIGNSSSATKLQTPRNIFGQSFNGTGDVTGTITTNTSIIYGIDQNHYLDLGGRNAVEEIVIGGYSPSFSIKDTSNYTDLFKIEKNGTASLKDRFRALYIHTPGTDNPTTSDQGAYISWNKTAGTGETDFINHKGAGAGGFWWYNTGGDGTSYDNLMRLDSSGSLYLKGSLNVPGNIISSSYISARKNASNTTADTAITAYGGYGGGISLQDTVDQSNGTNAAGFFISGGNLEINVGKAGVNGLRKAIVIDQSLQMFTGGNLTVNGYISTPNSGVIKSDDYHYIDIGKPSTDRMNFGSYGGKFNFINSLTNTTYFSFDQNGIAFNGSTLATLRGSGTGVTDSPTFNNNIYVSKDINVGGWIYAPYMTGTAQRARELESAKKINGVTFNNTTDINVPFPSLGTVNGYSSVPWDAAGGFYSAIIPNVDSRIILHSGNIGGSTPAMQIMSSYSTGGLWYRSARDTIGFEKDWTKVCTEIDGMAIAAKRLEQTRTIFGIPYNGTNDVNGNIYIDAVKPTITLKESGTGDAIQFNFQSDGVNDDNKLLIKTSVGGAGAAPSYTTAIAITAASRNVGIGTETPSQKLDVNGNIWANGFISSRDSVRVGNGTLYSNDNYHYLDLGASGNNVQAFGNWGGGRWVFRNTQDSTEAATLDTAGNMNVRSSVYSPAMLVNTSFCGIFSGNGDNASIGMTNMDIGSWWGIGIYDKCFNKRTGYFDARAGTLTMNGGFTALAGNRSNDFDYGNYAVRVSGDKSGGIAFLDSVNYGIQSKFGTLAISAAGADKYFFDPNGNFSTAGRISSSRAAINSPTMASETDYANYALQLTGAYAGGIAFLDSNGQYGIYSAFNELRIANGGNRYWTFSPNGDFTANGKLIANGDVTSRSGKFYTDQYHFIDIGNSNGGADRINFATFNGMFNFINTGDSNKTTLTINAKDGTINSGPINASGDITATGNVSAYSDRRIKTNLEHINNALSKINTLNGYTYDRTDVEGLDRQAGLIAQDVQAVLPEAVKEHNDILSVNYNAVIALLVESVKELTAEVNRLKGEA